MQIAENEKWQHGDWEYNWNANGSLRSVKLPNGEMVSYEYDALGRRTKKLANGKIKRYLWDGNVLLHEWEYNADEQPKRIVNKLGEVSFNKPEPINNLITWVYETNSFVPCAKIINNEAFSIINDYIGRPILAFDSKGEKVWSTEYDIYGNLKNLKGEKDFIPFRQLGQYEDTETGLYYNRFRYYNPETGLYISKDPIGLLGGFALYAYVKDSNSWVDVFGLHGNELTNITNSILYDIKINGMQFKYGIADATRIIKTDIPIIQPSGKTAIIPKNTPTRLYQQLRKAYSNFDDVVVDTKLYEQVTTAFMKNKEDGLISKFVQSNGKIPSGNKAHAKRNFGMLADDFNGIHDLKKDLKMKNNKVKYN